jgi:(R)-2-hydroxyacyl-CoA dehydratese activating ATPase
MLTCGIDVGSVSTEAVILSRDNEDSDVKGRIVSYVIIPTGANSKDAALKAFEEACLKASVSKEDVSSIVATGYGRINIPFANKNITEISCHARGVLNYFTGVKTVIDIGGQDSKVIKLDGFGSPVDFLMNDKCAAGTGRFLEVMARALEIKLEHFGEIFAKTNEKVDISSTCTVFAESEVVSLIGQGIDKNKIMRGLVYSIVNKVISMVERIGLEEPVCMTGGVAKNLAVVKALEEKLGVKINIPEEPEITGALGAAYLAK